MNLKKMFKNKKSMAKVSVVILGLISIVLVVGLVMAATHISTVELQPEWSVPNATNNYDAEICNTNGNSIDEVRIMQNPNYDNLVCEVKAGWTLIPVNNFPDPDLGIIDLCWYFTDDAHAIDETECETFYFDADAPTEDPQECFLTWKFETRDIKDYWMELTDTTNIDSEPPVTTKSFIGPQKIVDGVEWIDGITEVELTAVDMSEECGIGVEAIYYKNKWFEEFAEEHHLPFEPEAPCWDTDLCRRLAEPEYFDHIRDWETYTEPFLKEGESCHVLWYYSVDKLGNEEKIKTNCFFVDTTPPIGSKEIGEPKIPCSEDESVTGEDLVLILENKDSSWKIIDDGIKATLKYNDMGPEFDYSLTASGLQTNTDYSLIYYADKPDRFVHWGGDNPGALIATVSTDGSGNIDTSGSTDLGMNLPSYPDANIDINEHDYCGAPDHYSHCTGAKIWLVPSSDYSEPGLTAWNPDNYLFETDLIDYTFAECWWVRDPSQLEGTPITLSCEDQLPHPSGYEEVCFRISYDIQPWLTKQYCSETLKNDDDWCCVPAPETIIFQEDSLHDLEYFCRDAVNKKSEIDIEWFRVDSLPPIITKEMIGTDHIGYRDGVLDPNACPPDPNHNDECYVADNGLNGVLINVEDDQTYPQCAVDQITCTYDLWWYDLSGQKVLIETNPFSTQAKVIFKEDSEHELIVRCEDALGNSVEDREMFLVDSTPPITTKTYLPDPYIDPTTNYEYIDTIHEVELTATDAKVGVDEIRYKVSGALADRFCENCAGWMQSLRPDMGPWQTYTNPFKIPDESCHVIEYSSVDKLGNEEAIQWQCVFVDKTAPSGSALTKEPKIKCKSGEGCDWWIRDDTQLPGTPITLNCKDKDPHPSGVKSIEYRWKLDGLWPTSNPTGAWLLYTNPIVFYEDSVHELEYRCTDNVGKVWNGPGKTYKVDSIAPTTTKTYLDPFYEDPITGYHYIDTASLIELTAVDGGNICAVEGVKTYYGYELVDDSMCQNGCILPSGSSPSGNMFHNWIEYTTPFPIPDESCHLIGFYSEDALENTEEPKYQCVFVDKTPPETTKTYGDPKYIDNNGEWITSNTPITLSATDSIGPHDSGVKEIQYRVSGSLASHFCEPANCANWMSMLRPNMGPFNTYIGPFNIPDESCHLIEYYSIDNVDKVEDVKRQCVFVDNTPPTPEKTVEEPKIKWYGGGSIFYPEETAHCWDNTGEQIECWKVTMDTPILLDCIDLGDHPVDHEETCFMVGLDGDDATQGYCDKVGGNMKEGYCCGREAGFEFNFMEETEHNLKYYCVDALGNAGPVDEEKFKVIGNMFEIQINKKWNLISVPFDPLDKDIKEVLKDIENNIESVLSYDSGANHWYTYRPGEEATNDLEEIKTGSGYWVSAYEDDTLVVGGSLYSPGLIVPPNKKLKKGWNLIGYYGTEDLKGYYSPEGNGEPAYCALYSIVKTNLVPKWSSLLTYWEPYNHDYNPFTSPWKGYGIILDNKLDPGAGYWIHMKENGDYAPSTACVWPV